MCLRVLSASWAPRSRGLCGRHVAQGFVAVTWLDTACSGVAPAVLSFGLRCLLAPSVKMKMKRKKERRKKEVYGYACR